MKKHDIEHHIQMERKALTDAISAQLRSLNTREVSSSERTLQNLVKNPTIQNLALSAVSYLLEKHKARRETSLNKTDFTKDTSVPQKPFTTREKTKPLKTKTEFTEEKTETSPGKTTRLSTGLMLAGIAITTAGILSRKK